MAEKKQSLIERIFEAGIWHSRFVVILAVLFGLLSSIILFIVASVDIFKVIKLVINYYFYKLHIEHFDATIIGTTIGAVDMYLIGIVLLIFSFGIYELFISEVDIARIDNHVNALEIQSLDELKNKITKVIVMVLVVNFFQRILSMDYKTPLDMLYFALSIFALSLGLYLLHKREELNIRNKKNIDNKKIEDLNSIKNED